MRLVNVGNDLDVLRRFAASTDNLVVIFVANENNRITHGRKPAHFAMNFFYQRAGRIDNDIELFLSRLLPDSWRNSVGAKNKFCSRRNFVDRLNKADAPLSELADHVQVMDNFVENIDRRAVTSERSFHGFNRHLHTGAKTARLG